jgi:hypothetical protein
MAPVLPGVCEAPRAKSLVVSILSSEHPLTCRQIWRRIARLGDSVSYKAVHKAVRELSSCGVVSREFLEYELSLEWLASLRSFAEAVEAGYAVKARNRTCPGHSRR